MIIIKSTCLGLLDFLGPAFLDHMEDLELLELLEDPKPLEDLELLELLEDPKPLEFQELFEYLEPLELLEFLGVLVIRTFLSLGFLDFPGMPILAISFTTNHIKFYQ